VSFAPLPSERWAGAPGRYPDPALRALDPRFERYLQFNAAVERIATGYRWTEGPVWFGDHDCLLFSDIPSNRIHRWDARTGALSVFREPSANANGNTRDRRGRLVTCEHRTRRVTRTEYDGSGTVLAEEHEGRRLNAPNDVVVAPDDAVWFTDPGYGILSDYEGGRAEAQLPTAVYRVDPGDALERVLACASRPTVPASTSSTPARPGASTSTTSWRAAPGTAACSPT
jgi:gluconolactonase